MKQRPIVMLDRIRMAVVLDRIRTVVSVKWIQRETRANDGAGKNEWHLIDDPPHTNNEPMHGGLDFSLPCGFLAVVGAEDESAQKGQMGGNLMA